MSRKQQREIGLKPQTDRAIRRAARSARRASDAEREAAEAVQAASVQGGGSRGRTEGTYGVERVSAAKLVLWMQHEDDRAVALLSTWLGEDCSVGFRCHLESEELLDRTEFWIEIIWLDKIVGKWDPEVSVLENNEDRSITALLTWKAKDE